jgi:site-specific DNA-methyltransferase (adenine-specific)
MKPYYEEDGITIYHGDCTEIIPLIKWAGSSLITDPPYGNEYYEHDVRPRTEFMRLLIGGSHSAAIFGYPEDLISMCMDIQDKPNEWITWFPPNKSCCRTGGKLPKSSECIAIFGETVGANLLFKKRSSTVSWLSWGAKSWEEARLGDVWTDASPGMGFNSHLRLHPNEKPVSIFSNLVTLLSFQDSLIFDPFMGSGTTLRAAKDLGRKAIGIEIEEKYCEKAATRLAQKVLDFK